MGNLRQTGSNRQSKGFSLVELMVALTVGLILVVGLTSLVVGNMQGFGELNKAGYQVESARFATQFLRDELSMAGFRGNLTFPREVPDFPADPCLTGKADIAARYDIAIQADNDADASSPLACGGAGMYVKSGSDMLLLRRASTLETDYVASSRDVKTVYLATDARSFDIILGTESVAGISYLADSRFDKVRQFLERIIYVSSCSVCTNGGDGIPTLKMIELKNGSWSAPVPLVEGVEHMQLEFGVDSDEDGFPDSWTLAPANRDVWAQVAAVRFNLLMRNIEETRGYSDQKVYSMGKDKPAGETTYNYAQSVGPVGDGFKRHVYSMTVRLRNVAERREE